MSYMHVVHMMSHVVHSPRFLLPAPPPALRGGSGDGVMCASGGEVKVWRSVVSALCTATNNPQNGESPMEEGREGRSGKGRSERRSEREIYMYGRRQKNVTKTFTF